jgi:hypothetical protein
MHEGDVRDQVTQLEARIEALTESIERCRKIALGAKFSVAAGAIWFALVLFWVLPFDATAFVAALTAVLGGVVLLGSNETTRAQTESALHTAETTRTDLIGSIDLRVVGEDTRTIH